MWFLTTLGIEDCVYWELRLPVWEEPRFRVESIDGPCRWAARAKGAWGESKSIAGPGPLLAAAMAFLEAALCKDSGLKGLLVSGELKLGFLECCRPLMTEVWRLWRFEIFRCKPVSIAAGVGAAEACEAAAVGSATGRAGWAEAVREAEDMPWVAVCKFLPLVTEASLDWLPRCMGAG